MFSLDDIVKSTKGEVLSSPFNSFESIGTHSKVDLKNKIFIPLRGDRFDAHDFIEEAINNGANCIIYDKDSELIQKYIAQKKSTFGSY